MKIEGCYLHIFSGDTEICNLKNVEATVEVHKPEASHKWETVEPKGKADKREVEENE